MLYLTIIIVCLSTFGMGILYLILDGRKHEREKALLKQKEQLKEAILKKEKEITDAVRENPDDFALHVALRDEFDRLLEQYNNL